MPITDVEGFDHHGQGSLHGLITMGGSTFGPTTPGRGEKGHGA